MSPAFPALGVHSVIDLVAPGLEITFACPAVDIVHPRLPILPHYLPHARTLHPPLFLPHLFPPLPQLPLRHLFNPGPLHSSDKAPPFSPSSLLLRYPRCRHAPSPSRISLRLAPAWLARPLSSLPPPSAPLRCALPLVRLLLPPGIRWD